MTQKPIAYETSYSVFIRANPRHPRSIYEEQDLTSSSGYSDLVCT